MTIRFLKLIRVFAVLAAFALTANAQSEVVTVHVPFSFTAGGRLLPAGEYRVDREESSNILLMHGDSGHSAAFLTMAVDTYKPTENASLIFAHAGGALVLSAIRLPGQQSRMVIPSHVATRSLAATSPLPH
jgi:hypothetical protein